jgi:hypothetical protein
MRSKKLLTLSISLLVGMSILSGCGSNDTVSQNSSGNEKQTNVASNEQANEHSHEDGDDHHHAKIPGPNGGRLIVGVEPHFEFFVLQDHHAQITFVNDDIKPISPADLEIKLTGGERSNPIDIAFEKKEDVLLSLAPLPKEHNAALVLQISGKTLNETVFERFHLNMETCPDCNLHEYACICGHSLNEH